jgi:hypothetical protein
LLGQGEAEEFGLSSPVQVLDVTPFDLLLTWFWMEAGDLGSREEYLWLAGAEDALLLTYRLDPLDPPTGSGAAYRGPIHGPGGRCWMRLPAACLCPAPAGA